MITKPLFRKNFLIFASIILVFVVVAIALSWILTSFERDRMFLRPAGMNRALLDAYDKDPFKALPLLNEFSRKNGLEKHDLINADGVSLTTGKKVLSSALTDDQMHALKKDLAISASPSETQRMPGPPQEVISVTNQEGVFLLSKFGGPRDKPPIGPIVTLTALIACIIISIGIALLYQFSKYQERSREALDVLNSLREGNLSARLPSRKFDELALLTNAFNEMAGDLENMVEQLRKADRTRRELLQDLAHDLRTPLASLRSFLETLQTANHQLSEEKRQEVLSLSFTEVEYFGKLVEDLLFLAQITEPKYSLGTETIRFDERIQEQITVFRQRCPRLQFDFQKTGDAFVLMGAPRLIDRMLRNAFENSSSFAKSKIRIELTQSGKDLQLQLIDDGPGFSEKGLLEFGHKKSSRTLVSESSDNKRISVGIGSVIMKEIAQLHGGLLRASNQVEDGKVLGAKVSFSFTKS
ncbi:histidine kinase dimerization/phospho-acceptor domain-containing protein [Bdellovibrio sp. HCB117]|uniref:HAMP domain-containing sensor histidine kinase n=1 Tax=Bdellovibrio sp. HCB117 TaxID=3394359 RepID=UPI0039B3C03D